MEDMNQIKALVAEAKDAQTLKILLIIQEYKQQGKGIEEIEERIKQLLNSK